MSMTEMSSEGWRRVNEIFHAASEIDPGRRQEFLSEACAGDAKLMDEVQSLLDSGDAAPGFIEEPAAVLVARSMPFGENTWTAPQRIGPYQIVDLIGHGGMGTVYRAVRVDGEYSKTVAIKLVRQGMDGDYLRRRFLAERQILANLDHRNIARLLDGAATEDGLPKRG
ncbi:MAG: protein kinase [Acidobacteria bacterium]|nr:protein kinase [Acidobacteriota bacterium]